MTSRSGTDTLAPVDDILRPVAKTHRNETPQRVILALSTRARSENIPAPVLRRWVISRCPGPLADIASNRNAFGRLQRLGYRRADLASSPAGRARMSIATSRRLVGHLLSPLPQSLGLSPRVEVAARRALAALTEEFMLRASRDGYDTILVSAPWLGVRLGVGRQAASRALNACVTAGWVRVLPGRPGAARRFKVCRLTQAEDEIAWAHADLVDALVDGDTTPGVETLLAAAHPAVGYGHITQEDGTSTSAAVGPHAWLVGLCLELEIDPAEVGVGVSKTAARRHLLAWMNALAREGHAISSSLDAYAQETGAFEERDEAKRAERERAAVRTTEVQKIRRQKALVRERVVPALLAAHPTPKPSEPARHWDTWRTAMTEDVDAAQVPKAVRQYLAERLASAIRKAGSPEHAAMHDAHRIVGLDTSIADRTTTPKEAA